MGAPEVRYDGLQLITLNSKGLIWLHEELQVLDLIDHRLMWVTRGRTLILHIGHMMGDSHMDTLVLLRRRGKSSISVVDTLIKHNPVRISGNA